MKHIIPPMVAAILWVPITGLAKDTNPINSHGLIQDNNSAIRQELYDNKPKFGLKPSQLVQSHEPIGVHIQADCTPNPDAMRVGIYHFAFSESDPSVLMMVDKHRVHKQAAPSLRKMMLAAQADGAALIIASGFRSVKHQQGIINRKIKSKQIPVQIYRLSAPAGYSEHHTGLAVDFSPLNDSFAKTKAYAWLIKNAHNYGWHQTYTKAYSQVSGVAEEPWHWKYRGDDIAAQMLRNDTCLPHDH